MADHLKPIVEALIFASPDPITPKTLYKLLDAEPREDVDAALASVRADYDRAGGLQLVEIAGGYQIVTRSELHEWVRKLFHERTTQKLSVQSLETLAVIAYKQPVTAPEIAEIRGVTSSGGVLSTLIERKLIKTVGRKQVIGRPFMYATTREFLERFGLNDLTDLPKVEEMSDALGFELPTALAEPVETTSPLPFEAEGGTAGESGGAEPEAEATGAAEGSGADVGPDSEGGPNFEHGADSDVGSGSEHGAESEDGVESDVEAEPAAHADDPAVDDAGGSGDVPDEDEDVPAGVGSGDDTIH